MNKRWRLNIVREKDNRLSGLPLREEEITASEKTIPTIRKWNFAGNQMCDKRITGKWNEPFPVGQD